MNWAGTSASLEDPAATEFWAAWDTESCNYVCYQTSAKPISSDKMYPVNWFCGCAPRVMPWIPVANGQRDEKAWRGSTLEEYGRGS